MNNQEVFDTVVRHLLKQGQKSIYCGFGSGCAYLGSACAYRGVGGAKCAIGCLIKDEFYSEDLEGEVPPAPIIMNSLLLSGVDCDPDLLRHLQVIHDRHYTHEWLQELKWLAKAEGLTFPEIKEEDIHENCK